MENIPWVMEMMVPKKLVEAFRKEGYQLYLVGGPVRDLLMGLTPNDLDFATDATPDEMREIANRHQLRIIPTGEQHGTMTFLINGEGYEVTTFRSDGDYTDGRRPDQVNFKKDIREDLARRDFTINATAINAYTGETVDPFGGAKDIQQGIIRAVGNPHARLNEDLLRAFRAIRFASRFQFTIEQATFNAIKDVARNIHVKSQETTQLKAISAERIKEELLKAMKQSLKPSVYWNLLEESGLLARIIPEATYAVALPHGNPHHRFSVFWHMAKASDHIPPDQPFLRFIAFLHDIGKPFTRKFNPSKGYYQYVGHEKIGAQIVKGILVRLRFSRKEVNIGVHLVKNHMFQLVEGPAAVKRQVRKLIDLPNVEPRHLLQFFVLLKKADLLAKGRTTTLLEEVMLLREISEVERHADRMFSALSEINNQKKKVITGHDVIQIFNIDPKSPRARAIKHVLALAEILHDHGYDRDEIIRILREMNEGKNLEIRGIDKALFKELEIITTILSL